MLEAQILMLCSHNFLNPSNCAPITVPSQDMVLGLYYITKLRKGAKGEGLTFYGPEEALIAYNEGKCDIHAPISVIVKDIDENGNVVAGNVMPLTLAFDHRAFDLGDVKPFITKLNEIFKNPEVMKEWL